MRFTVAPALGMWSHKFVRLGNGNIVAVGFSRKPRGVALARYLTDGRVDRTFRRRVWPQLGAGSLRTLAAARQADDKILVAACAPPDCSGPLVLARFRTDGAPDASFGEGGFVRAALGGASLAPRALALGADGNVVVVGEVQRVPSSGRIQESFVAQFRADGRLDARFGKNGFAIDGELVRPGAVLVQPDGRIVVGGANMIVRLLPTGEPDSSFGRAGGVTVGLSVSTLLPQPDRTVVAGGSGGSNRRPAFALSRIDANGKLDRSFARDGRLLHSRRGDHWGRIEALLPARGNRIVGVGWATRGTSVPTRRYRFVLLLVTRAGRLDRRFGRAGRLTLDAIVGQATAAFAAGPRRLVAVGAGDDLHPKQVVFARIQLP